MVKDVFTKMMSACDLKNIDMIYLVVGQCSVKPLLRCTFYHEKYIILYISHFTTTIQTLNIALFWILCLIGYTLAQFHLYVTWGKISTKL